MDTRQFDIEELMEQRKYAPNAYIRDSIDKAMDNIARETKLIRSDREKLIMAVRNSDRRAVQYFQDRIRKEQVNQTYGKQDY